MNLNNYLIFIYSGKAATSPYYEKELPKITAHCIHEAESGPLIQTHFFFFFFVPPENGTRDIQLVKQMYTL